ncbi:hypothetical protein [Mycolicibacterium sp. 018/SC-01/001]|uniref:hypothetical protein n=1 Tax=Mycolicibacterium sp. 018/SC-01/001 TaxID=2592069 RepID=UPI00117F1BC9|nr:hypothetical protein [Mycolicibacterium sp. 018/SC-01/001]
MDVLMSVPLVNPNPIYVLPGSVFNNHINRTHPTATYDSQQCPCGCNQYEADGEAGCFKQTT